MLSPETSDDGKVYEYVHVEEVEHAAFRSMGTLTKFPMITPPCCGADSMILYDNVTFSKLAPVTFASKVIGFPIVNGGFGGL